MTMMMKPSLFQAAVAVLTLTTITTQVARADDKPKTPLAEQMSGMSKDLKALRKIVNDPAQKDAAVNLAKDMEEHAMKAKGFEPSSAKDVPAADKDAFVADYKKQMDGLIADMQKLEADLSAGNTADASAMLDTLGNDRRTGHKKFNTDNH